MILLVLTALLEGINEQRIDLINEEEMKDFKKYPFTLMIENCIVHFPVSLLELSGAITSTEDRSYVTSTFYNRKRMSSSYTIFKISHCSLIHLEKLLLSSLFLFMFNKEWY
jgi:hypothetical protein